MLGGGVHVVGFTELPTVVVEEGTVVVYVDVVVDVKFATGVDWSVMVAVLVTVTVCCGPTERLKSRSYAIGVPFPLFEIMMSDQSPL